MKYVFIENSIVEVVVERSQVKGGSLLVTAFCSFNRLLFDLPQGRIFSIQIRKNIKKKNK